MQLTALEQIINGTCVFMPSGLEAEISMDEEGNILVKYSEGCCDCYPANDFIDIINDGVEIISQPEVNKEQYYTVQYKYPGDEIQDYTGEIKILACSEEEALEIAKKELDLQMAKLGKEPASNLVIVNTEYPQIIESQITNINKLDCVQKHTKDMKTKQSAITLMNAAGLGVEVEKEADKLVKKVKNEDYDEDDCDDSPEEMHKERYVVYFETQEGRQKYTIYHVYTDSTDDSYNELCDKRDNQLGMYSSYKELKDALKEKAEKIAKQQGWTVKSIDNLGEDDEYYRERNKWESIKESGEQLSYFDKTAFNKQEFQKMINEGDYEGLKEVIQKQRKRYDFAFGMERKAQIHNDLDKMADMIAASGENELNETEFENLMYEIEKVEEYIFSLQNKDWSKEDKSTKAKYIGTGGKKHEAISENISTKKWVESMLPEIYKILRKNQIPSKGYCILGHVEISPFARFVVRNQDVDKVLELLPMAKANKDYNGIYKDATSFDIEYDGLKKLEKTIKSFTNESIREDAQKLNLEDFKIEKTDSGLYKVAYDSRIGYIKPDKSYAKVQRALGNAIYKYNTKFIQEDRKALISKLHKLFKQAGIPKMKDMTSSIRGYRPITQNGYYIDIYRGDRTNFHIGISKSSEDMVNKIRQILDREGINYSQMTDHFDIDMEKQNIKNESIEETPNYIRTRLQEPNTCKKDSFRTKEVNKKGDKMVFCQDKNSGKWKAQSKLNKKDEAFEGEKFTHFTSYNKCKDINKVKELIKLIRDEIKDAQADKDDKLVEELKQDLQKAKSLRDKIKALKMNEISDGLANEVAQQRLSNFVNAKILGKDEREAAKKLVKNAKLMAKRNKKETEMDDINALTEQVNSILNEINKETVEATHSKRFKNMMDAHTEMKKVNNKVAELKKELIEKEAEAAELKARLEELQAEIDATKEMLTNKNESEQVTERFRTAQRKFNKNVNETLKHRFRAKEDFEGDLLTDVNNIDLPQVLADTVEVNNEGEVVTLTKVADMVKDLKDQLVNEINMVKAELQIAIDQAKEQKAEPVVVELVQPKEEPVVVEPVIEEPTEPVVEEPVEEVIEEEPVVEEPEEVPVEETTEEEPMEEDLNAAKKEIDNIKNQGGSATDMKNAIDLNTNDDKEKEEATKYATQKLKESLFATAKTSVLNLKK